MYSWVWLGFDDADFGDTFEDGEEDEDEECGWGESRVVACLCVYERALLCVRKRVFVG